MTSKIVISPSTKGFFLETKINFMQISSAMRFSILKQKKKRKTLMMKEEEGEKRNHGIWQECLL